MHQTVNQQVHEHNFLGASQKKNERRTLLVIGLTAVTMVVEIASGLIFGSMALLADGWHMASHTGALGITWLAYFFARRYVKDPRFTFGTGKIGDLAGFSSALLLGLIALIMAYESLLRLFSPTVISYDEAILVAVVGLIVNLLSAVLLKQDDHHAHGDHHHHRHGTDHNIRSAHLHVLADALTSILAICALTMGKYWGLNWMDPIMGLVGSVVIARWSLGLLKDTGRILMDVDPGAEKAQQAREILEWEKGVKVVDLHVWRLGPGHYGAIVSLIAQDPAPPDHYKERLAAMPELSHITVEVCGAAA